MEKRITIKNWLMFNGSIKQFFHEPDNIDKQYFREYLGSYTVTLNDEHKGKEKQMKTTKAKKTAKKKVLKKKTAKK